MSTRFTIGRYLNEPVIVDTNTGYMNASQICINNNKKINDWVKTPIARGYIEYFTTHMNCLAHNNQASYEITHKDMESIHVLKALKNSIIGVYYHKYLIHQMLQWSSPMYALKSSVIVDEYNKIKDERSNKVKDELSSNNADTIVKLNGIHMIVSSIQGVTDTLTSKLDKVINLLLEESDVSSSVLIDN